MVRPLSSTAVALLLALAVSAASGCGPRGRAARPEAGAESRPPSAPAVALVERAPAPAPPRGEAPLVVFLGDSLTAGLGLEEDQAYPFLVGAELERRGAPIRVINAGISGDTSAGGLERLDWLLAQEPDVVVVALGANDGLRGLSVPALERNLRRIVERSLAADARVLLAGMRMPPNYGADYTDRFEAVYPKLARELDVPLLPFLLEGVGARPDLNQPDGLHPNAAGQRQIARLVADALEPLVEAAPAARAG
jgi:acyl-CoA thioesterase-1